MIASARDAGGWAERLRSGRVAAVDELKGVAILLIIAFHVEIALVQPSWVPGPVGVDIFLILSGLTLGRSLSPTTTARAFFQRRFFRVFPAYWIALAFFVFLKTSVLKSETLTPAVFIHVFALQAFGPAEYFFSINPSFWFMSLLLVVYPLAFLMRQERSPWMVVTTGVALGLLTHGVAMEWGSAPLLLNVPARIVSFCAGFAIARSVRVDAEWAKGGLLLAVLAVVAMYLETRGVPLLHPALFGLTICVSYVTLSSALHTSAVWRRSRAFLAATGAISYEIYLLHQPLFRFGIRFFGLPENTSGRLVSALFGLTIGVGMAWILHAFLDRLYSRSKPGPVLVAPSVS
jgi:peptidoglycan/LPS O-acetylase OafA/YrhL